MIAGGDSRPLGVTVNTGVSDVNIFDSSNNSLVPSPVGDMNYQRWYPTLVTLASGQAVILGGTDINGVAVTVPEIYTPGEGWRALPGAVDTDFLDDQFYPRSWVGGTGEIFYFTTEAEDKVEPNALVALNPSGDGSLRQLGDLPFTVEWQSPAIMYKAGHVLIMARNGDLWTMDITGATPVYAQQPGSLGQDRNWANMAVLADGSVVITGGTSSQDSKQLGADYNAAIWDPLTGLVNDTNALETDPRLYHSTSILLTDGTILSMGGGAGGGNEANFLTAQTYIPPYLYDSNGDLAARPVITASPDSLVPGQSFSITVDDASAITRLTFIKTGAITHSLNMDTRLVELEFTAGANNTLLVTLPDNANDVTAGNWMLFAWNDAGVPSVAPIIQIEPTQALYDSIGDLRAEYFEVGSGINNLDAIDFEQAPDYANRVGAIELQTVVDNPNITPDDFAIRYSGVFNIAATGDYIFYLLNDDSARLSIDGITIANQEGASGPTETITGNVNLTKGLHAIEVLYFDDAGTSTLNLDWSGPGFSRTQMIFDGAESNLQVNGALELASITTYSLVEALPGWTSSSGEFAIHPRYDGFGDPSDVTGKGVHVQINEAHGALSQSVQTGAGSIYSLSFDIAGKPGASAGTQIEIVWNTTVIETIAPQSIEWRNWQFDVTGTGGLDTLTFRSGGIGEAWDGVYLDSAVLQLIDAGTTGPQLPFFDTIGDLRAEYFNLDSSIQSLADIDFTQLPDYAIRLAQLNLGAGNANTQIQSDEFAIRYSGMFHIDQAGVYRFYMVNDDSARLIIDGNIVANQEGTASPTETITNNTNLAAGLHTIEVLYFDNAGTSTLDLDWSGPGFARTQMIFDGAERNLLVNGALELAGITTYAVVDTLPGWTSSNGQFAIHPRYDGFADTSTLANNGLNIQINEAHGAVSQTVQTDVGKNYNLSFNIAGKPGAPAGTQIEIVWNTAVIATITPQSIEWRNWQFEVTGTGGPDTLTFRSAGVGEPWDGVYLDSVVLQLADAITPASELPFFDTIGDLRAEYFELDSSVQRLADIDFTQSPDYAIRLAQLDLGAGNANTQIQSDDFAIRYTGKFHIDQSGDYHFFLVNDDSARLIIDGNIVANQEGTSSLIETVTGNISLAEGLHTIEILYFDDAGATTLDLDWSGPGFVRTQMIFDGAEHNLLVNGALELPGTTSYSVVTNLPGWSSSSGQFAVHPRWQAFAETSTLSSNGTHLQINEQHGSISQSVQTKDGIIYRLSFDLAAEPGALTDSETEVLWNGEVVAAINPANTEWRNWEFNVTGTGGLDTLTFRSTEIGSPWDGTYLDSIVLQVDDRVTYMSQSIADMIPRNFTSPASGYAPAVDVAAGEPAPLLSSGYQSQTALDIWDIS